MKTLVELFEEAWFIFLPCILYLTWYLWRVHKRSQVYAQQQGRKAGKRYFWAEVLRLLGVAGHGRGYGISCPNCGRTHVRYLDETSRKMDVERLGMASSKIGKTYECPSCRHTW